MNFFEMIFKSLPLPMWVQDTKNNLKFINDSFKELFCTLELKNGTLASDLIPTETLNYTDATISDIDSPTKYVGKVQNKKCICILFPFIDNDNNKIIVGLIITCCNTVEQDIDIESQQNIFRTIIDALPEEIFYKDKHSKFIGFNRSFKTYYEKLGVKELIGKSDLDVYPDSDQAKLFIKQDQEILKTKQSKYTEYSVINSQGQLKYEECLKVPVINDSGEAWGIVGLSRDITERKTLEDKLRYLSYTDSLTGLYNRSCFDEKLNELNDEKYLPLGIIMGDVNGLKLVNDTFGHYEGDNLLKCISTVLEDVCQDKGLVFRWGGDEFMILLPNYNEQSCENLITEITETCNKYNHDFIQLSIALGESVKSSMDENVYDFIKEVEEKVYRRKLLDKKSIRSTIIDSLKKSLEEKNTETEEHTERVTQYAYGIGRHLGFKLDQLDELFLVAKLHDIGKIGIKEEILLKPSSLTKDEFEIMKTHTEKGYRIIQAAGELEEVAKCVLCHHERWDGTGYPLGLISEEIPLMARIISVVDSFDVMTTERPYKKAMSKFEAIEELKKCANKQFDPKIVDIFISIIE